MKGRMGKRMLNPKKFKNMVTKIKINLVFKSKIFFM